eukprot:m.176238 g.176238  ORF g.176238 m.176238 type:complete len:89 (+) comp16558_c3_seq1:2312-2578(+)
MRKATWYRARKNPCVVMIPVKAMTKENRSKMVMNGEVSVQSEAKDDQDDTSDTICFPTPTKEQKVNTPQTCFNAKKEAKKMKWVKQLK